MNKKYKHLPFTEDIAHLNTKDIENNLFNYSYHSRYLTKLLSTNFDKEDPHYLSTYSSFVGEVYENVIYELLIRYAVKEDYITKFVLKGPHQNGHKNEKNGLLIDRNDQIVYKSGYKDVSEFDGLFFANDELWFVESTIVKTTTSLKKRLKKKKALLQLIFPKLTIRSLIILSTGVIGANTFPSYCTVWVTKQLEDTDLINRLLDIKNQPKREFEHIKAKKLIETKDVHIYTFKYFETLSWILRKVREDKKVIVDKEFLNSEKLDSYFDIFSKLYIGYILEDEFKKLYPTLTLENIDENKIVVTIEKVKTEFVLIYYAKVAKGKLKKLEILEDNTIKLSDKDPKGFTASETKFMKYIWKPYYQFFKDDIININKKSDNKQQNKQPSKSQKKQSVKQITQKVEEIEIEIGKKKDIYILSDRVIEGVSNLPTFQINFLPTTIDLSVYDALIFTSKNGILSLDSFNPSWKNIKSYAISHQTAKCITNNGGNLEYTGINGHGNKFAQELIPLLKDKKVLYIKPKTVVSKLVNILAKNEILCDELVTYETVCKTYKQEAKPPKDSIIILSSPSTLKCFLEIFGWDETYLAIVIGKTTQRFLPEYINYKVAKHTSLDSCIKLAKTFQ